MSAAGSGNARRQLQSEAADPVPAYRGDRLRSVKRDPNGHSEYGITSTNSKQNLRNDFQHLHPARAARMGRRPRTFTAMNADPRVTEYFPAPLTPDSRRNSWNAYAEFDRGSACTPTSGEDGELLGYTGLHRVTFTHEG